MSRLARARLVVVIVGFVAATQPIPVLAFPTGGALPPPLTLELQVAGSAGVPADAIGVALNVTVTEPLGPGFLTVYPCGDRPLASNLNYEKAQTVPNFVVTGLSADGTVCFDTMAVTDIVVDIAGYIPSGSSIVPLASPMRFVDTRTGIGAPVARVAGGTVLRVPLAGRFGVDADAQSVIVNATAVDPSDNGFLSVFPCGQGIPETSTLNFTSHAIVPNLAVSALGDGGALCFYSNVATDVVADVAAFVPAGAGGVESLDRPHRIVDTRIALGSPDQPLDSTVRPVAIGGLHGVPTDADAAIVNLTAADGSGFGYVSAFPCGAPAPLTSNLNFGPSVPVGNLGIVKLSEVGTMCVRASVAVDLIVDVLGYIDDLAAFVPLSPVRLYDSRELPGPPCKFGVRQNESTLEVIDFMTATVTPLADQPVYTSPPSVYVSPSCQISVVGFTRGSIWVDVYSRTGAHVGQFQEARFVHPANMSPTVYGLIGLSDANGNTPAAVVHVETGAVIVTLPNNGSLPSGGLDLWNWVGATTDATLFALKHRDAANQVQMVYWDDDGAQIGSAPLPAAYEPLDISPSGDYVLSRNGGGGIGQGPTLEVTTRLGAAVASLPSGVDPAWFTSDGSVAACVRPVGSGYGRTMGWNLFSDPQPLTSVAFPPGCLIAASG